MTRKRFPIVNTAAVASFAYTPPDPAYNAARILIKPNLASRPEAPTVVSPLVLGSVLRGLRRAAPMARLVIVEGGAEDRDIEALFQEYGIESLLDQEMRLGNITQMVMFEYILASGDHLTAPEAVQDYDCVISVAALDSASPTSPSLHNIVGFLPWTLYLMREALISDAGLHKVSEAFGPHIDGAVVEVAGRVVWGPDLAEVDAAALKLIMAGG